MMKLTIKTIDLRTLQIEILETQSVSDLKFLLCSSYKFHVAPTGLILIHDGHVLNNCDILADCILKTQKPLVVLTKRFPEALQRGSSHGNFTVCKLCMAPSMESPTKPITPQPSPPDSVSSDVSIDMGIDMGFDTDHDDELEGINQPREKVLIATFANIDIVIISLVGKIIGPSDYALMDPSELPSAGIMAIISMDPRFGEFHRIIGKCPDRLTVGLDNFKRPQPTIAELIRNNQKQFKNLCIEFKRLSSEISEEKSKTTNRAGSDGTLVEPPIPSSSTTASTNSAKERFRTVEHFRHNPLFYHTKRLIKRHPVLLTAVFEHMVAYSPTLWTYICTKRDTFLDVLQQTLRNGNREDLIEVELNDGDLQAVERIRQLGVPMEIAVLAYITFEKIEQVACSFFRSYIQDQ